MGVTSYYKYIAWVLWSPHMLRLKVSLVEVIIFLFINNLCSKNKRNLFLNQTFASNFINLQWSALFSVFPHHYMVNHLCSPSPSLTQLARERQATEGLDSPSIYIKIISYLGFSSYFTVAHIYISFFSQGRIKVFFKD